MKLIRWFISYIKENKDTGEEYAGHASGLVDENLNKQQAPITNQMKSKSIPEQIRETSELLAPIVKGLATGDLSVLDIGEKSASPFEMKNAQPLREQNEVSSPAEGGGAWSSSSNPTINDKP